MFEIVFDTNLATTITVVIDLLRCKHVFLIEARASLVTSANLMEIRIELV
jgi:hypothetical protein